MTGNPMVQSWAIDPPQKKLYIAYLNSALLLDWKGEKIYFTLVKRGITPSSLCRFFALPVAIALRLSAPRKIKYTG
jgi:hypothetical protein